MILSLAKYYESSNFWGKGHFQESRVHYAKSKAGRLTRTKKTCEHADIYTLLLLRLFKIIPWYTNNPASLTEILNTLWTKRSNILSNLIHKMWLFYSQLSWMKLLCTSWWSSARRSTLTLDLSYSWARYKNRCFFFIVVQQTYSSTRRKLFSLAS